MASPVADTYSAPSGAAVYGGRYGLGLRGSALLSDFLSGGGLSTAYSGVTGSAAVGDMGSSGSVDGFFVPTWRSAMAANTWVDVPTSNLLSDLDPKNNVAINPNYPASPEWYGDGHYCIISAWCGAAFDVATDDYWLPLGGGHRGYAGNEPYKLNLYHNAPTWTMIRPPSGAIGNLLTTDDGQEATGKYADNRPRAVHAYNNNVFVPGVGPAVGVHGSCSWNNGGATRPIFIHPTTGEPTFKAYHPLYGYDQTFGSAVCYDSSRHAIWFMTSPAHKFTKYDIATDVWVDVGANQTGADEAAICWIPGDDVIAWFCAAFGSAFKVFDPVTATLYAPTVSGSIVGGAGLTGKASPVWVPSLNALAFWDNTTSTTVINIITKPANPRTGTWVISQLPVSGSNAVTPTAKTALGTYNRFQYSPRLDGFVVINATNQRPYFYALS